jgi:branched-chain amino acid transport system substrate-binding protein
MTSLNRLSLLSGTALLFGAIAIGGNAQEGEPIRIGAAYPQTGAGASQGSLTALGHQMAIDEINENGGLLGRPVEMVWRDSKGTPADATIAARDLITLDNVDFFVGGYNSGETLAMSEVALQEQTIYIASVGKTIQLTENYHPYQFRTAANTNTEGGSAAIILDELGAQRVCTLLFDYAYGHDLLIGFEKALETIGSDIEIVAQAWPALGVSDYTPYIGELLNSDCDSVFSGIWSGEFLAFAKQADSFGLFDMKTHWAAAGEVGSQDIMEELGADMPNGIWTNSYEVWYYPNTPEHNAYLEKVRALTGTEHPNPWPSVGYIGVQALAAGIEAAGTTDTDAVIAAMEGLTFDSLVGPLTIGGDGDHQANRGQYWGVTAESEHPYKVLDQVRYVPADDIMH